MRVKQRKEQREIETKLAEEGKDVGPDGKKLPSLYCKTCKLMFHQVKMNLNMFIQNHRLSKTILFTLQFTLSILTSMFLEREHWLPNINVDEKKIVGVSLKRHLSLKPVTYDTVSLISYNLLVIRHLF